mmetsp:Transcript_9218/g.13655  ORF Transcript_9218/g.13655 Transcript_9218/m.13655 type:complete len:351 (+) Transcript_9218:53-1105(+)|eukprot:CAMPEP_0117431330 /NCGR_PEP_ID=MMETSP0758-20121206/10861_1 /TAXON_ID=63605 /ORGANISM="Percolomonas cosmopolitus, Strain AE-1 (ATCC 50343)" /LENGTH=350 /DNA_ID=CAMNT_0005220225 /DNA_START=27 /DNA_END=1079 /DNA_ORIENTATION=-
MTTVKLAGMGNPLLDIASNVTLEMVEKYGGKFGEATLANEENMGVFDEIKGQKDVSYTAGGATLNVFRVFAWMRQEEGENCVFTGCVGDDEDAKVLETNASKDGLDVHFQQSEKKSPTGNCAVLVVGKERTLIANIAAANDFNYESMKKDESFMKKMRSVDFYYISGFFLTVSVPSMLELAVHAAENNKTFCMNISAPFLCQFFTEQMNQVLPYCDYVFGNEDEAAAIAKMLDIKSDNNEEIAKAIVKLDKKNTKRSRVVVITQGSKPTIVAKFNDKGEVFTTSYDVKLIDKEKIVDTNGAGDSFCGGFMSQLVDGASEEQCVRAGQYAASYMIQKSGIQMDSKPTFKKE